MCETVSEASYHFTSLVSSSSPLSSLVSCQRQRLLGIAQEQGVVSAWLVRNFVSVSSDLILVSACSQSLTNPHLRLCSVLWHTERRRSRSRERERLTRRRPPSSSQAEATQRGCSSSSSRSGSLNLTPPPKLLARCLPGQWQRPLTRLAFLLLSPLA